MPRLFRTVAACSAFAMFVACQSIPVFGHGYAGERFFPPTITTDDPFAADELALPTVSTIKGPDGTQETDVGFEFDKLILPNLSFGVSDTHVFLNPEHGHQVNGWENVELNVKYNAYINEEHEFIASVGMFVEIGGTGTRRVDREPFTTFEPTFFFGKGFGDLPDSLAALKPLAVTGSIGQTFNTSGDEPNALNWGFSLQYQLPYLQSHVRDIGLPKPFSDMILIVEFPFSTAENREDRGITTGSFNPCVLWETKSAQFGIEAIIPVNNESGTNVGVVFQIWIFLDDIDPEHFGHAIFGGHS